MSEQNLHTIWPMFLREPDAERFQQVYAAAKDLVWTLCLRILGNEDDAGDAFQETWRRLLAELPAPAPDNDSALPGPGLIYRLALRESRKLLMRRRRRSLREVIMDHFPSLAAREAPADEVVAAGQLRAQLETLLRLLPERRRLPLQLHYFHGLSQIEIAELLGRDKSTVSRQMAGGLRELGRLARRAGLREAALGSALAGAAGLIKTPEALAASAIYAQAQAALTVGAAAASGSVGILQILSGAGIMNVKGMVMGAALAAVVGVGGWYGFKSLQSQRAPAMAAPNVKTKTPPNDVKSQSEAPLARAASISDAAPNHKTTTTSVNQSAPPLAPASSPAQASTSATLALKVIWAADKKPAAGAEAVLRTAPGGLMTSATTYGSAVADAGGKVLMSLRLPAGAAQGLLLVKHPAGAPARRRLDLPRSEPLTVELDREGVITGRVLSETARKPVAGAEVSILLPMSDRPSSFMLYPLHQALTGSDGEFRFGNLATGEYRLTARKAGARSSLKPGDLTTVRLLTGEESGPHDLILKEGVAVTGIVTDKTDGKPVPGVKVATTFSTVDSAKDITLAETTEAVTNEKGVYRLAGLSLGPTTLKLSSPDYEYLSRRIDLAEPETYCNLELSPAGTAEVRLIDDREQPVQGARLVIKGSASDLRWSDVRTDARGEAVLGALSLTQPQSIAVICEGYRKPDDAPVQFKPGERRAQVTIRMQKLQAGFVQGRVTGPRGEPLAMARVLAAPRLDYNQPQRETLTDAAGRYTLLLDSADERYLVSAALEGRDLAPDWREDVKGGPFDKPTQLDFALGPGHWLKGVVVDKEGKPIPGVSIAVSTEKSYRFGGLPIEKRTPATDDQGRFELWALPAPRVALALSKERHQRLTRQLCEVDREVRITLAGESIIRGRVIDARSGEWLPSFRISYLPEPLMLPQTDRMITAPDGKFELDRLYYPSYQVVAVADGYAPAMFSGVRPAERGQAGELTFALAPGAPLIGRVIDRATGKPLPGVMVGYSFRKPVRAILWNSPMSISPILTAITDAQGRFRFQEGSQPGSLFIKAAGYLPRAIYPPDRPSLMTQGECVIPLEPGEWNDPLVEAAKKARETGSF